jgi:predicted exporter
MGMKTRKTLIIQGSPFIALGILSGLVALATMVYTWNQELSTLAISMVVGLFSAAVSLILVALDRRKQEKEQTQV